MQVKKRFIHSGFMNKNVYFFENWILLYMFMAKVTKGIWLTYLHMNVLLW